VKGPKNPFAMRFTVKAENISPVSK